MPRIIDAITTELFNVFAAGAYFGLWEGMEIYLNTYYLTTDELGISAIKTVVGGKLNSKPITKKPYNTN